MKDSGETESLKYKPQNQTAKRQTEILKHTEKSHIANKIAWERSLYPENTESQRISQRIQHSRTTEDQKQSEKQGWERTGIEKGEREASRERQYEVDCGTSEWVLPGPIWSVTPWTGALMHLFSAFLIMQVCFFWKGMQFHCDTWHLLSNCGWQDSVRTIWVNQHTLWSFFSNFWRHKFWRQHYPFPSNCC